MSERRRKNKLQVQASQGPQSGNKAFYILWAAFQIIFQNPYQQSKSSILFADINNSCTFLRVEAFFMILPAVTYVHFYEIHSNRNQSALHFLK